MKRREWIKIGIIAALLALSYVPTFQWMWARWNAKATYYSHGMLIPFICAFIIWQKRKLLSALPVKSTSLGWTILIPALFIHLVSTVWQVGFASGFMLLPIIAGLILLFFGKKHMGQLAFPVALLASMVPAPEALIAGTSFRLKLFAAQSSVVIMRGLGIPTIREGSLLRTPHASLMVEDPCSGIRSLVALITLGALMAYYSNLSKAKRGILFVSSIPIAVSTNIIRITALGMVSEIYGEKYAGGLFHDTMGILVFVFAFAMLAMVAKVME